MQCIPKRRRRNAGNVLSTQSAPVSIIVQVKGFNLLLLLFLWHPITLRLSDLTCADGQRNIHNSLQDFGNDSGNDDGVAAFDGIGGGWDDDNGHGDMDEPFGENLVTAPRKVSFSSLVVDAYYYAV